ncbi:MAG TPA: PEP-CTERM sorting domain-containing protein [Roseateles sp.]
MKPLLLAAVLVAAFAAAVPGAQAQFNPPGGPMQKIDVRAGNASDGHANSGQPGWLDASASESGIDASGDPFHSATSASTRLGPGHLSGSLAASVSGSGTSSASLSAYQTDALTFSRKDGGSDNALVIHYNIVIAGGTSASMTRGADGSSGPGGQSGGAQAGSLDWTFVHQLDGFYTTSWDSTTTLTHDGSVATASHWNVGAIGNVYAVYTFAAAISAGRAMDMDFYLEMNSRLNAIGPSATGTMTADAPTIYWGGISQVTDWYGRVVDYAVTSASGFNYALSAVPSPAPEPSTWAMLLAGVAVLAGRGRSISRMRRGAVGPSASMV